MYCRAWRPQQHPNKHDNEKALRVLFLHFEVPTESNEGIASTPNRVDAEEGGGRRGMGLS